MTATSTQETRAAAILIEAAARVASKESQRDDIPAGVVGPICLKISGTVGKFEISNEYQVTLAVDPDGIKTPGTPYQEILASLIERLPEDQRAAELAKIAAGEFAQPVNMATKQTQDRLAAACKQWREAEKARDPQPQRGSVKPVYSIVAATVATPKATRTPAVAADVAATAAAGNGSSKPSRRKAG